MTCGASIDQVWSCASSWISNVKSFFARKYGSGPGSCGASGFLNDSSASSVTTHGEMLVAKFFARNGPSGCIPTPECRARSSRSSGPVRKCDPWHHRSAPVRLTSCLAPRETPFPVRNQSFCLGRMPASCVRRFCLPARPAHICPATTTELARPWYATGNHFQFGISAFSGPRNIVPTLCA